MKAIFLLLLIFLSGRARSQETLPPKFTPAPATDSIRVFPNPMVNELYITVRQQGLVIKTVLLYDAEGNRVLEQPVRSVLSAPIKIFTASLLPGRYFLVLETNKQPYRRQLMKQ